MAWFKDPKDEKVWELLGLLRKLWKSKDEKCKKVFSKIIKKLKHIKVLRNIPNGIMFLDIQIKLAKDALSELEENLRKEKQEIEKNCFIIKPDPGKIHGEYLLINSIGMFFLGEDIIPSQVKQIEAVKRLLDMQNNAILNAFMEHSLPTDIQ